MLKILPVLNSDSYKQFHALMYPEGMTKLYSNMTPRATRFEFKQAVWFGLQYYLKEVLIRQWDEYFFKVPKEKVIADYKRFHRGFSFTEVDTKHIEALHDLRYMPLLIKALPEGALVNMRVPFYTITNTHPDHAWLVNFLETQMSTVIWDLITVATVSFQYRLLFSKHALKTTGSVEGVQWQGHDFAMRGRTSLETSQNQAGHLLSFTGTDTIPAVLMLEEYYNANIETELIGASVPATEHSVMTSYGKEEEITAFRRILQQFPTGIVSVVSDSFDLWQVLTKFMVEMKDEILARDGKLVIRPDSGDPIKIITGYTDAELTRISGEYYKNSDVEGFPNGDAPGLWPKENAKCLSEAERKGVVELLWDVFGGTTNELGYRLLDSHIGCIYGDSITLDRAAQICERLAAKGFASTNWVAGIGSYTFNYNTRDSLGIAVKSTYCEVGHPVTDIMTVEGRVFGTVNGAFVELTDVPKDVDLNGLYLVEEREIFKDPITDDGVKKSAKGRLRVDVDGEGYYLTDQVSEEEEQGGALRPVFCDGQLIVDWSLKDIRALVDANVNELLK
jgi:nicotinamide phosphoribosyltransferase